MTNVNMKDSVTDPGSERFVINRILGRDERYCGNIQEANGLL